MSHLEALVVALIVFGLASVCILVIAAAELAIATFCGVLDHLRRRGNPEWWWHDGA